MPSVLSTRDFNVLEKIRDPESNPQTGILVDPSLPKDPIVTDDAVYGSLVQKERDIILTMQQLEFQMAGIEPQTVAEENAKQQYRSCVARLGDLISEHPNYASARNNRAQAARRLYGDGMLLVGGKTEPQPLLDDATEDERRQMAGIVLSDLDQAISLLTPKSPFAALSPQQAKTLSLVYTQRAAIYHATSKLMLSTRLIVPDGRKEAMWERLDFEEAASRDFTMGGRYGNEVAKGLAVSTNPTAKLCGQMVREAMRKEYGPGLRF